MSDPIASSQTALEHIAGIPVESSLELSAKVASASKRTTTARDTTAKSTRAYQTGIKIGNTGDQVQFPELGQNQHKNYAELRQNHQEQFPELRQNHKNYAELRQNHQEQFPELRQNHQEQFPELGQNHQEQFPELGQNHKNYAELEVRVRAFEQQNALLAGKCLELERDRRLCTERIAALGDKLAVAERRATLLARGNCAKFSCTVDPRDCPAVSLSEHQALLASHTQLKIALELAGETLQDQKEDTARIQGHNRALRDEVNLLRETISELISHITEQHNDNIIELDQESTESQSSAQ